LRRSFGCFERVLNTRVLTTRVLTTRVLTTRVLTTGVLNKDLFFIVGYYMLYKNIRI
jgi:hypothetical protein